MLPSSLIAVILRQVVHTGSGVLRGPEPLRQPDDTVPTIKYILTTVHNNEYEVTKNSIIIPRSETVVAARGRWRLLGVVVISVVHPSAAATSVVVLTGGGRQGSRRVAAAQSTLHVAVWRILLLALKILSVKSKKKVHAIFEFAFFALLH